MSDYGFRSLAPADLPVLSGWLAQDEVARWWPDPGHQLSLIREDMDEPGMTQLIVNHDGQPIAYVQHYPAHLWDAPQFADLPADSIALDLFSAPRGFGHGAAWLRSLGEDLLNRVSALTLDPLPENTRAIRAFRRAGFGGDMLRTDADGVPVRVMTRRR